MVQSIRVFKKRLQISQKKWNTVQGQSLRTVNTILNTISRLNLIQRPNIFSTALLERFYDIPERLAYHLADLVNKSIADLYAYLSQFSDVVDEMRKIEAQFRFDFAEIAKKSVTETETANFHDLEMIEIAERTIQEIIDRYETELSLRKQIIFEIQEANSIQPLTITAYLVLWTAEIYIEPREIHELFEEFTQAEKLYERMLQSQDSFNSIPKSR
ncbi:MAG: hypothetical protein ACFFAU_02740 [Candidatus Hodarchaeota archaeon]